MRCPLRASVRAMTRALPLALVMLAVALCAEGPASAQQTAPEAGSETVPPGTVITTAPNQPTQARQDWLQKDLEEATERSRRTRIALISTSAAFAVGVVLGGAGASQCDEIRRSDGTTEWVCNNAGNVLVPLGGTIAGLSAIGMITSGIMLGVANKRKREAERDIRRSYSGHRFHWDIPSGRFVF